MAETLSFLSCNSQTSLSEQTRNYFVSTSVKVLQCLCCHFLFAVKTFINNNVYQICEFFKADIKRKKNLMDNFTMKMNKSYFIKTYWGVIFFFTSLNFHVYISVNKSTDKKEKKEEKDHFACIFYINAEMFCAHKVKWWMNFLENIWVVSADTGQQCSFSDWQLEHSSSVCYNTNITLNLARIDVVSFPLLALSSHKVQSGQASFLSFRKQ